MGGVGWMRAVVHGLSMLFVWGVINSTHPPTHPPTGDCALAVRVLYSDEQHFPARLAVGNVPDPALVFPAVPAAAYVRTFY